MIGKLFDWFSIYIYMHTFLYVYLYMWFLYIHINQNHIYRRKCASTQTLARSCSLLIAFFLGDYLESACKSNWFEVSTFRFAIASLPIILYLRL